MLPLAADEDLHGDIIRGLCRRVPGIDLVRAQDAGLSSHADPEVLEWAAAEGRVLVSQDKATMIAFAWDRVRAGLAMPGLIIRSRRRVTVGQAIDWLELIACCGDADDFKNRVRHLPLWRSPP